MPTRRSGDGEQGPKLAKIILQNSTKKLSADNPAEREPRGRASVPTKMMGSVILKPYSKLAWLERGAGGALLRTVLR